jgi:hypothetical protein
LPDVAAPALRRLPGGWPLLAIALALAGLLLLAGIPASQRVAGDGSSKLRHGWARERAAQASAADSGAASR